MNTIIEKIRAEVERMKVDYLNRSYTFVPKAMQDLLDFLSDLEKEEKPKKGLHHGSLRKVDNPMKWMEEDAKEPNDQWSEEDEKMLETFLHKLEVCDLLTNKEVMWAKHRLKSFHLKEKSEKPTTADGLEKEIKETFDKDITTLKSFGAYSRFARHFYELGRQSKREVCEGLEEEIINYFGRMPDDEDKIALARHFAQWQKEQTEKRWLKDRDGCFWDGVNEGKKAMQEQMMKEAVEGWVSSTKGDHFGCVTSVPTDLGKLYGADKCKIIIIKER